MARTVAVCSLGGSPGATTLALALSCVWPGPTGAVLVEADASGGDVAAWRRLYASPGLIDLAAAARRPAAVHQDAWEPRTGPFAHAQTMPGGLAVCPAPTTAERATGAVMLLAQNPAALTTGQGPATVLDVGRLAPRSPGNELAAATDAVLLVVRDDTAQLRRVKESTQTLSDTFPHIGLVVVGGGGSTDAISDAVGLPVWERVRHDAKGAAFLRGERHVRRPLKLPLLRAAASLTRRLARETLRVRDAPVGVVS